MKKIKPTAESLINIIKPLQTLDDKFFYYCEKGMRAAVYQWNSMTKRLPYKKNKMVIAGVYAYIDKHINGEYQESIMIFARIFCAVTGTPFNELIKEKKEKNES